MTDEKTLLVLDAAHIKPYAIVGSHELSNNLSGPHSRLSARLRAGSLLPWLGPPCSLCSGHLARASGIQLLSSFLRREESSLARSAGTTLRERVSQYLSRLLKPTTLAIDLLNDGLSVQTNRSEIFDFTF